MRLMVRVRSPIAELDTGNGLVRVHNGKGGKVRAVALPRRSRNPWRVHLDEVQTRHRSDLAGAGGERRRPPALARKMPNAQQERVWQHAFPSARLCRDPDSGQVRRHHLRESAPQRGIKAVGLAAGTAKQINSNARAIRFQRICWRMAATSEPSTSSTAILMCRRP
jgi:hypothetical protein